MIDGTEILAGADDGYRPPCALGFVVRNPPVQSVVTQGGVHPPKSEGVLYDKFASFRVEGFPTDMLVNPLSGTRGMNTLSGAKDWASVGAPKAQPHRRAGVRPHCQNIPKTAARKMRRCWSADYVCAAQDGILTLGENGAGEEIRTLDPNLGKVVLYH